jgi:hypothetical protein
MFDREDMYYYTMCISINVFAFQHQLTGQAAITVTIRSELVVCYPVSELDIPGELLFEIPSGLDSKEKLKTGQRPAL